MRPFTLEVFYGKRVAVLGSNGSGKSPFLWLLAGEPVAHEGRWKLGARVQPGYFAQTHERRKLLGKTLIDILWDDQALARWPAMTVLRRLRLSPNQSLA